MYVCSLCEDLTQLGRCIGLELRITDLLQEAQFGYSCSWTPLHRFLRLGEEVRKRVECLLAASVNVIFEKKLAILIASVDPSERIMVQTDLAAKLGAVESCHGEMRTLSD